MIANFRTAGFGLDNIAILMAISTPVNPTTPDA